MAAVADRLARLAELKRALPHKAAPAARPDELLPTGSEALDRLLAGGLLRGRLTELVGWRSAGRTALGLSALGAATRRGETVALVDVDGTLDPESALQAGLLLERLLWVRAGEGARGLRAAELILGAGGFGLVALDVGERRARVPDVSWLRLARAAERSEAALLVIAPWPQAGSFAAATVEASRPRPRLSPPLSSPVNNEHVSPRILRAVSSCVTLVRSRRGAPEPPGELTLRLR